MNKLKEIESNFDKVLLDFIESYDGTNPIEVSFRELVPDFSSTERATHSIHSYPAKLLGHIPYFFINNKILSKPNDIILDPFCGSGTVLLEAILAGKNAFGIDVNPLARLISSTKTTKMDLDLIDEKVLYINRRYKEVLKKRIPTPNVVNIDYWYSKKIQKQLTAILHCIKEIEEIEFKNFFLIALSVCARKSSLADPRVSVPVKLKRNQYSKKHPLRKSTIHLLDELKNIDVFGKFIEIVEQNKKRLRNFAALYKDSVKAKIIGSDARLITKSIELPFSMDSDSIDLIITSPPYAGAQKYIRASSLNLNWTELAESSELKKLDNLSIGRENYPASSYSIKQLTSIPEANDFLKEVFIINPLRAHIASNYLNDMECVIKELHRVLKKGKYFILVAANNFVCGKQFLTQKYLKQLALNSGFQVELELVDEIQSYGLMTKRNKTASLITREIVTVFKKV